MKVSLDVEPSNTIESTNINSILIQEATPLEQLQNMPIQPSSSYENKAKKRKIINDNYQSSNKRFYFKANKEKNPFICSSTLIFQNFKIFQEI